jgi:transcriptional regulator with XRE-family HTH domain
MSAMYELTERSFPELVRQNRLRAGLTQQQLADLSAISVRAVRDLEAGRVRRPRRDTIRLLSEALRLGPARAAAFSEAAEQQPSRSCSAPETEPGTAPLLGRDAELATLQDLLIAGDQRLISVVGLPGSGKSRLLDEIARRFGTLGWIVSRDPGALPSGDNRVQLLILDPGPDGVAELVGDLHRQNPQLRILHCAEQSLQLPDEYVLALAGLPVTAQAAVALFVSHARRARPGLMPDAAELATIAEICQLLDGMPAAIAHAADWSLVLSWPQLRRAAEESPLAIAEPPAHQLGSDWPTRVRRSLRSLPSEQWQLLCLLAGTRRVWSLETLCQQLNLPPVVLAKGLHALTVRGLLAHRRTETGTGFQVPHLLSKVIAPC